jgi:hypothetical protein
MEQKISKFLRNGSSQNKAWFLCNSGIVWKLSCLHLLFVIIYDLIVSDFDFVSPKWAWRSCSWKKSDKRPDRPWVRYLEGVGGFWWHNTEGHLQLVIFLIKNCRFTFPRASIKDAQATVLKMPLHLFSIFVGNILPFWTRIRILNTSSYCNLCSV